MDEEYGFFTRLAAGALAFGLTYLAMAAIAAEKPLLGMSLMVVAGYWPHWIMAGSAFIYPPAAAIPMWVLIIVLFVVPFIRMLL